MIRFAIIDEFSNWRLAVINLRDLIFALKKTETIDRLLALMGKAYNNN